MSVIKVTCISAQLTHDTEMFSNMDPYVVVQCGSEKRKTRTHQEGGKRPQWNDSFSFANPKSQQLKFVVWDEDNVTDDLVGEGVIDIDKFAKSPNIPAK
jgi:Ca2+-dependent lipid-binding protein